MNAFDKVCRLEIAKPIAVAVGLHLIIFVSVFTWEAVRLPTLIASSKAD